MSVRASPTTLPYMNSNPTCMQANVIIAGCLMTTTIAGLTVFALYNDAHLAVVKTLKHSQKVMDSMIQVERK
jgi:hypothetical protein